MQILWEEEEEEDEDEDEEEEQVGRNTRMHYKNNHKRVHHVSLTLGRCVWGEPHWGAGRI